MARTANPYTKVIKRLAKLQAKADRLNSEIAAFTKFVEMESKGGKTAPSPSKAVAKTSVATKPKKSPAKNAKKAVSKTTAKQASSQKTTYHASKATTAKKASGGKAIPRKADGSPDYLAMLNWDGKSEPPKAKSKKAPAKPKAKKA